MPIYEYRCDDCGHEFETIQKFSDEPLKTCPACAHDALRKKISAAGFRLKGGGWYETDFKAGGKKNLAGEQNGGKESKSSGSEASGSSKDAGSSSGKSSEGSGKSSSDSGGGAAKTKVSE